MKELTLEHILKCHSIKKTDIIRGNNTDLFCKEGKRLIDFEAGMWCTALGHSNKRITNILIDQASKLMNVHYKLTCDIAEVLAVSLLKKIEFDDGKAVFLSSGSEAVELSIRLAKLVSRRNKLLTFSSSYLSAFSNAGGPRDNKMWIEVDFLQCNSCCSHHCTTKCDILKNIDFSDISTFVLESALGGRVLFPPQKLVNMLVNEVKKYGGIIVANEVTTGLGRTGEWFGYNHYNIKPDIVALGKSLGNGYPISGIVMNLETAKKVEEMNFTYVQSHQNDPLGCAVAIEVLNIMTEDNIIQRSKDVGCSIISQLREIQSFSTIVKEVRGRGLLVAMEFNSDAAEKIADNMLNQGYFIGTVPKWNIIRFSPALTISQKEITSMCNMLEDVIEKIEKNKGILR
ncbi:aminotransferase class III-fold pyridoxal phosphate-dependent enzyme [Alkaliphilus peptidifermentans]|uniref:Acetylornithine aminotransferase n=1 Tax=Alkaliphilus peptidifermentans DSM 18978 TaxID=1120976 RepID=A0A1G5FWI4_9FIRM|nr:aminotransferase class III-fold pyridoxal phosphate-dependent enzyme [Alkaliphilus peptidifermentans]SCY43559.1 acetylornithine aminotransferase [Alkaliphilus peptidifermentans DSM 18978]